MCIYTGAPIHLATDFLTTDFLTTDFVATTTWVLPVSSVGPDRSEHA